jgi:hypothetical protein
MLIFSSCYSVSAQAKYEDMHYDGGPVVNAHQLHLVFLKAGRGYDYSYYQRIKNFFTRDLVQAGARVDNVYGLLSEYRISFNLDKVDWYELSPVGAKPGDCPRVIKTFCMSSSRISRQMELLRSSLHRPNGFGDIYLLAMPRNSTLCGGDAVSMCVSIGTSKTLFRGYHSFSGSRRNPLLWGVTTDRTNSDTAINTLVHEHLETITNPVGGGWWSSFGEMDDVCKLPIVGSIQHIGQEDYWLERPWSNHFHRCVMDTSGRAYPLVPPRPQMEIR